MAWSLLHVAVLCGVGLLARLAVSCNTNVQNQVVIDPTNINPPEVNIAPNPPNVVFIVADDLGWNDVGWHNPAMLTPNLDRYANMGVILNDSYVQPVCSPSRNCFMTGLFPYHTGLQHEVIKPTLPQFVPERFTMLPQLLKKKGYSTHIVGKWHLGFCNWKYTPTYRGFDSFFGYYNGHEDYYMHRLTNPDGFDFRFNTTVYHGADNVYSAISYAERVKEIVRTHDKSKPLFLYLPFQSVHTPLEVPERFENLYSHIQNRDRRVYSGMVSALDEAFGNVTRALEDSGIADNMLLIFTTDNGGPVFTGSNNWPLRGAKATTWQGGTRGVAFVYSSNLLNKKAYVNNEMIHAVDWFPTILDLAGLKPDAPIDGVSQLATILNGAPSKRTEFVYNIDEIHNQYAIRMGDYKLMKGSAGFRKYNWWYRVPTLNETIQTDNFTLPGFMLFNLKEDPTERNDISQTHPRTLETLKQRLAYWMTSLVPAQNPPPEPRADPLTSGGIWGPGWC